MGDGADYLESQGDDGAERDMQRFDAERRFQLTTDKQSRYRAAECAEIGATMPCPNCSRLIVKRTYNRRFCGTPCKDRYWNTVDPTRAARARAYNR